MLCFCKIREAITENKVTKLRTFSVPPLAPPLPPPRIYGHLLGSFFLKARTKSVLPTTHDIWQKNAYVTILRGTYPFH